MTKVDKQIVEKFLKEALEAIDEIESIVNTEESTFIRDRRARFSLRYSVILAVEALADIAVAILEKDFNQVAETYREAFIKLAENAVINLSTAREMAKLASLRNIIVHRYWTVDDLKIYEEAKKGGVEVLRKFIQEVKQYIETKDP